MQRYSYLSLLSLCEHRETPELEFGLPAASYPTVFFVLSLELISRLKSGKGGGWALGAARQAYCFGFVLVLLGFALLFAHRPT